MKLLAKKEFWNIPLEVRNLKYKGCGPGKFGDWIIPDNFWGLNVTLA